MLQLLTMDGCNPCKEVKSVLDQHGVDYVIHDVKEGSVIVSDMKVMMKAAGIRTVPTLFSAVVLDGTMDLQLLANGRENIYPYLDTYLEGRINA